MKQHPDVELLAFKSVPREVLPLLKEQLEQYGAQVVFETEFSGSVTSIAGCMKFNHAENVLHVMVDNSAGHFSRQLLIGGIRQMVEEACEQVQQSALQKVQTQAQVQHG